MPDVKGVMKKQIEIEAPGAQDKLQPSETLNIPAGPGNTGDWV